MEERPTVRKRAKRASKPMLSAKKPRVIIVMPAYNAERTLKRTVADVPKGLADEIILVDDKSKDNTIALSKKLGLTTIAHKENRGYGGNQKTCYDTALAHGADIVVMIHPDYQYDPTKAGNMVRPIAEGKADIVLGSRIRSRKQALAGGMPLWRYVPNRVLTWLENRILGLRMSELHTGYRAYSRQVLETVPYHNNSDDYVFDSEFLVQARYFGFRFGETPVPVRYLEEASSPNFARSLAYGLATLRVLGQYVAKRFHIYTPAIFDRSRQHTPANAQ